MNKWETFEKELEFIKDETMKEGAKQLIEHLPDYFFEVPASSTGKYHPKYACGQGGLVRHTKAAVRIAESLFRLEMYAPLLPNHDAIIIALLLHDGWKHGQPNEDDSYSEYTNSLHPKICSDWLLRQTCLPAQTLATIAGFVLTHMGQWNMEYRTGIVFAPKPATSYQMFVHLCDYLASRKFLELVEEDYTL